MIEGHFIHFAIYGIEILFIPKQLLVHLIRHLRGLASVYIIVLIYISIEMKVQYRFKELRLSIIGWQL
jgi:hypothetical protein